MAAWTDAREEAPSADHTQGDASAAESTCNGV
jgi:hypothetical protein